MLGTHFVVSTLLMTLLQSAKTACPAITSCLASSSCSAIPLPERALPLTVPRNDYVIIEIRTGVYSYSDGFYSTIILHAEKYLVLIDFPGPTSPTYKGEVYLLATATLEVLQGEIPTTVDMIYGHRHMDHIGGAGVYMEFFKRKFPYTPVTVRGTAETAEFLARNLNPQLPKITDLISTRGHMLKVGPDLLLHLQVVGGHTQSDIAAHILPSGKEAGVLHYADVVNPGVAPFHDFGLTEDLYQYIAAQRRILQLSFRTLSAGHGRLGTPRDVERNLAYTVDAIKFSVEANEGITTAQLQAAGVAAIGNPAAPEFRNVYLALKLRYDLLTKSCAKKLVQKWSCELGAVDLFASSHCLTAYLSSITDKPI